MSVADCFSCPLSSCCHCGGRLHKHNEVSAIIEDLGGRKEVTVNTKECCRRGCRRQYGPNFFRAQGGKINCLTFDQVDEMGVIFVSTKRGFTVRFLKFFSDLAFRGYVSSSAVQWVYDRSFPDSALTRGDRLHTTAIMYYHILKEMKAAGCDEVEFNVDEDVPKRVLNTIDKHLHDTVFPGEQASTVTELVGDGNAKVLTKCDRDSG